MLISEELFLLLRRDDGKPESAMGYNAYGLTGAVLGDLILAERLTVDDGDGSDDRAERKKAKNPVVSVVPGGPTGHPVLDGALERLAEKDGKKLSDLVADGKVAPEERIAASLADAGVIDVEQKKMLGLVGAKYPVRDPAPEAALRERLRVVLAGGTPSPADGILLSILQGIELAPKILDEEKGELGKKQLKARIEEVASQSAAGTTGAAVAKAVESMNAALIAATVIPAVSVATTAGS